MATKTYVLLESMDATAPVYRTTPDGKRSQVKKIQFYKPTLRQEFEDENGISRVIRYKSSSRFIEQDKQIKEENIPANAKWTMNERRDLLFKFGVLTTNKERTQQYLESHPEYVEFKGTCDTVRQPTFKLLDQAGEAKIKNEETRKRVKASYKIFEEINLEQAQELIIRLNGFYVQPPNTLSECQNKLIDFLDDAEIQGIEAILKEDKDLTIDEKNKAFINKLILQNKLSLDVKTGMFKKDNGSGQFVEVKKVVEGATQDEKVIAFATFLNSEDGKTLKSVLEKELKEAKKSNVKEQKTE